MRLQTLRSVHSSRLHSIPMHGVRMQPAKPSMGCLPLGLDYRCRSTGLQSAVSVSTPVWPTWTAAVDLDAPVAFRGWQTLAELDPAISALFAIRAVAALMSSAENAALAIKALAALISACSDSTVAWPLRLFRPPTRASS